MLRAALMVVLSLCSGCGYALVTAEAGTRIGPIEDLTAQGDLGIVTRRALRGIAGAAHEGAAELSGRVRALGDQALAFDGTVAQTQSRVVIELVATRDGAPIWQAQQVVAASWRRGATLEDSLLARRAALHTAIRQGVDRLWLRWTTRGAR
ncbi:MAG: hypothetical protein ACI9U2_003769 [Bradymonadia bacterium]|jgi:hypothetical protein